MKDRAMQALSLLSLEPLAELNADHNSYGFRPERSVHDAIEQCFKVLCHKVSAQWVLEADIKGCFDNISHDWLIFNIPMDKKILNKWLKSGFLEKSVFFHTRKGTPQGGIISPVLANIALDGLEKEMIKLRSSRNPEKINLVRYADDFVITGASSEILKRKVKPVVDSFLEERGLSLSVVKTRITHIEDGFDFLGQTIRKYNGKLLIKPSKSNVKTFLGKIRKTIKENKALNQEILINLLNPMIRGWTNYHARISAKRTFGSVENEIWRALWRWAKRRHSNKNKHWIRKKYFKSVGGRNGVFACRKDGKLIKLFDPSSIPIRRHVKIKGAAHPFDPQWDLYFNKRRASQKTRKS